jgi:hypothetical protein
MITGGDHIMAIPFFHNPIKNRLISEILPILRAAAFLVFHTDGAILMEIFFQILLTFQIFHYTCACIPSANTSKWLQVTIFLRQKYPWDQKIGSPASLQKYYHYVQSRTKDQKQSPVNDRPDLQDIHCAKSEV